MLTKRPDPEDEKATLYSLSSLSSGELLQRLERLVRRQGELTAEVLAHVGEVDARKLYLGMACSSMFVYCTDVLHLSRGATYKRIHAARAARKHPEIYELVAAGRLHLSAVCLLAPHLTADNGELLLAEAAGCTKRQVEQLLAKRFPKPDVETTVRALPRRRGAGTSKQAATPPESRRGELSLLSGSSPPNRHPEPAGPGDGAPAPGGGGSSSAPVSVPAVRRRDELAPLSERRYKIQLTAGQSLHDKLQQAQQLLGDRVAHGDLASVFEQGLDLLIRDLRRKRFAETDRPRRPTKRNKRPAQGSASSLPSPTPARPPATVAGRSDRITGLGRVARAGAGRDNGGSGDGHRAAGSPPGTQPPLSVDAGQEEVVGVGGGERGATRRREQATSSPHG